MILVISLIISFELGAIAYFAWKNQKSVSKYWILGEQVNEELRRNNANWETLFSQWKLTFDREFAKRIEDIIKGKYESIPTVKMVCDDGVERELPIEQGW
jgi:hypothetical protein